GTWLSSFSTPGDVERIDEEKNHITTVYLHDYVSALQQAGDEFADAEQRYEAFMNSTDSSFPRMQNLKHRESMTLSSLAYSICGNNETYQRNLAYSDFIQWHEATIEEHIEREMPFKAAAQRARALLMTPGLHAALIDYEYSDSAAQRNDVETIITTLLEQFVDSPEVITCIGSLLEEAYTTARERQQDLQKQNLTLADLTENGNEDNWWETFIANPESPVNRGVLPASEAAAQILELSSHALATLETSHVVVDFIMKNRFQKNSAGVRFSPGEVVLHAGKAYTSDTELQKLFESVFPEGSGGEQLTVLANDGSVGRDRHYTIRREMTTVRKTRGQTVGAIAQGLDRALTTYGIATSAYAFAKAESSGERMEALLGYAKGIADMYTSYVTKATSFAGQTRILFAKSLSGSISIAFAVQDYQQKGRQADILWRQGRYDRAAARRLQQHANILAIGSNVAALYVAKSALVAGGIGSNVVPVAGQFASGILLVLAALLSAGVYAWERWIHRDALERWLAHCIPWGNSFSRAMSGELPWTRYIAYPYAHNHYPISLNSTNRAVNTYSTVHSAFSDISTNTLFRSAEFRERFDTTPGFFRRANYIPYQILQATIAVNSQIGSAQNQFQLTAMLHNHYHYFELEVPEEMNLFEEYYSSRAYDARTGQTLYLLGWTDSAVANRPAKKKAAAESYAQHNMEYFDSLWGYSALQNNQDRYKNAIDTLNMTLKKDLMPQQGLTDAVHLLSGSNWTRRDIFLRIALELSDGSDIAVRRMTDVPLSYDLSDRAYTHFEDYERSLPGRPPETPERLPDRFR
ncbi:hypothetical protein SAMN05920897_1432, partial [Alkalispirochaeta americana]